jgi:hypothetical protein
VTTSSDRDLPGNAAATARPAVPAQRSYTRSTYDNFSNDRDEIENILILPCWIYLYLALGMRTHLRRWIGRKAGNVIGAFVILVFGGPPIVFACVTVLLFRLVFWSLGMLDKVRAVQTNA